MVRRKASEAAPIPDEKHEQIAIFEWAQWQYGRYPELLLLYHTPNGGSRPIKEAVELKAQGVKPGVPDIFLPVARGGYHGLYIELKRLKRSRTSDAQLAWIDALREQGFMAEVCHGAEDAISLISWYLAMKSGQKKEGPV